MNSRLVIAFLLFANFLFSQTEKDSTIQMALGESIYGDDCILTRKTKYDK
jgi:hypothetical protein